MKVLIVLSVLVAVASALPVESESELLKRVLEVLSEEKRELNVFDYDPDKETLLVSFKVCVMGDKSLTPCRPVTGHSLRIFDSTGGMVAHKTVNQYLEKYGGPHKVYQLADLKLKKGEKYTLLACELDKDGHEIMCNQGSFTDGKKTFGFGRNPTKEANIAMVH